MKLHPMTLGGLALSAILAACGGSSAPVQGLDITEVTLFQGVRTTVMRDNASIEEPAVPVVQGRYALFRVHVRPREGWQERKVGGTINLYNGDKKVGSVAATPTTIRGESSDGDLASTVNFEVPGEKIGANFGWAVRLTEGGGPGKPAGGQEGGFFPATGSAPLRTKDLGKRLKIVLVPMRYKADGSNRVPDTSATVAKRYRDLIYATYPAPTVDLKVREPIDLDVNVGPGTGWSQALDVLLRLRNADAPGVDVYYYGVFNPAGSFGAYCTGGCITGLSTGSQNPSDSSVRGSIGVGFVSDGYQPESTFIHEVGHAHGRMHAPCGLGGQPSDRSYPHSGATLGAWGYDFTSKELRDPSRFKDFMSYCDPIWSSDYTYRGLLDRIYTVNASVPEGQLLTAGAKERWRMLRLTARGLFLGSPLDLHAPPSGEKVTVERADAAGAALTSLHARLQPYSHLPGGIVFVRERDLEGVDSVSVGAHTLRIEPEALRKDVLAR